MTQQTEIPEVSLRTKNAVGVIEFFHPKANSLPSNLLAEIASGIEMLSNDDATKVILLKSRGEGAFCAGASRSELDSLKDAESAKKYFMGFAQVFLAIKNSPKFIVCRIHGKVVGGGLGLVAASDYALATENASIRLPEILLGIGPLVVGVPIERKIGGSAFASLALGTEWHDSNWALSRNLFHEVAKNPSLLDEKLGALLEQLADIPSCTTKILRETLWQGTDSWAEQLETRATLCGELLIQQKNR